MKNRKSTNGQRMEMTWQAYITSHADVAVPHIQRERERAELSRPSLIKEGATAYTGGGHGGSRRSPGWPDKKKDRLPSKHRDFDDLSDSTVTLGLPGFEPSVGVRVSVLVGTNFPIYRDLGGSSRSGARRAGTVTVARLFICCWRRRLDDDMFRVSNPNCFGPDPGLVRVPAVGLDVLMGLIACNKNIVCWWGRHCSYAMKRSGRLRVTRLLRDEEIWSGDDTAHTSGQVMTRFLRDGDGWPSLRVVITRFLRDEDGWLSKGDYRSYVMKRSGQGMTLLIRDEEFWPSKGDNTVST
ncbi:hypothetical protein F3Y22_tig00117046pilonHSYRG00040 [Hibiscus syriacus]|uniref:Uncharacterized protein n=1 Tax=Hibiscus syriacus TaxID=106335 RepID=A0A6A2WME5_HIBSY|nr:hypothetical protein F3Y22_tig00117046pilonHSYRG00040 [Hibiscus syriacus]